MAMRAVSRNSTELPAAGTGPHEQPRLHTSVGSQSTGTDKGDRREHRGQQQ